MTARETTHHYGDGLTVVALRAILATLPDDARVQSRNTTAEDPGDMEDQDPFSDFVRVVSHVRHDGRHYVEISDIG